MPQEMNDLVSIVMPVYNAEKYLEEAIESCLNQTYSNIEFIAVNDGSTDSSPQILERYSKRIKIISQKNKGISAAANTGIKNMRGDWLKWMSNDDILYPNDIEELISEAKKFQNRSQIVFYSNCDLIDSEGKFLKINTRPDLNCIELFEQNVLLLNQIFPNINTSLIPASAFEKCGYFDETFRIAADYEFWLRLGLQYEFRFHLVPKNLMKYRLHINQATKVQKKIIAPEIVRIKKIALNRLNKIQRTKYLNALEEYQKRKKKTISQKIKRKIDSLVSKTLPDSSAKKVSKIYRKAVRKNQD